MNKVASVGRNDPCPCGSGRKYKKCCIPGGPREELLREAFLQGRQREEAENKRKELYGDVKPIIHTDFHGYRFVAIGSELHFQPVEKCQSFPDFLWSYLGGVLGKEWGEAELAKPYELMHPLVQWHVDRARYNQSLVPDDRGLVTTPLRGPAAALIHLAYDLYTLRHNAELQDELVQRLRHRDQFQGAKYEALAAATFVRSGFEIAFEDEKDPNGKHPEFIATHKLTGQKLALEAKSKHWSGVLGFSGRSATYDIADPDVRQIVNRALKKAPQYPYVLFVDLNLPPLGGLPDQKPWFGKISRLAQKLSKSHDGSPAKFTLLVFSNFSYHFVAMDCEEEQTCSMVGIFAEAPNTTIQHPECLLPIIEALQKYDNLPIDFPAN